MTIETYVPDCAGAAPLGLGQRFHHLARQAVRLWQLRQATRKLEGLDDRALSDLGISRADIGRVVHHGRPPPRYFP